MEAARLLEVTVANAADRGTAADEQRAVAEVVLAVGAVVEHRRNGGGFVAATANDEGGGLDLAAVLVEQAGRRSTHARVATIADHQVAACADDRGVADFESSVGIGPIADE